MQCNNNPTTIFQFCGVCVLGETVYFTENSTDGTTDSIQQIYSFQGISVVSREGTVYQHSNSISENEKMPDDTDQDRSDQIRSDPNENFESPLK